MLGRTSWVLVVAICVGSLASAVAAKEDKGKTENLPTVDISKQTKRHVIIAAGADARQGTAPGLPVR